MQIINLYASKTGIRVEIYNNTYIDIRDLKKINYLLYSLGFKLDRYTKRFNKIYGIASKGELEYTKDRLNSDIDSIKALVKHYSYTVFKQTHKEEK